MTAVHKRWQTLQADRTALSLQIEEQKAKLDVSFWE